MWTLSGFADEIGPDLDGQLDTVAALGVTHIELRSVWGIGVLDLTDDQRALILRELAARNLGVSSIGSPIGKIGILESFSPHLERMRHCVDIAHDFSAPFIRLFNFYIPSGEAPAAHRDEVLRRMTALAEVARQGGVTLLHENESAIYGDVPQRCLDIVETVDSDHLRLAWDPANFVQCGIRPHTDGYQALRPYLAYVQVKDAFLADVRVVPAGEGDGEFRQTVRALAGDGFDGFFSLEPHLRPEGRYVGWSGSQLWAEAHRAFTELLVSEGIRYH